MAFERKWQEVPSILFATNGGADGSIAVISTSGLKVKQIVTIDSATQPTINLQVKRVLSSTILIVGPKEKGINTKTDISAYLVADGATVSAAVQDKNITPPVDHEHAVYEQEPTLAKRTISVDEFGNFYTTVNPLPVGLSSFPLPTGAATEAKQDDTISELVDLNTNQTIDSDGDPALNTVSEAVLFDSSGNPIATHLSADGGYHLATAIIQDVYADTNNSSTDNLVAANSYTFTGTATSTLGVVGLQWSLKTDQNATVCIDQSPDGTNWDVTYCFDYIASKGGQGETVQATQAYWRIRVILDNGTDTTYFRLGGVLCPIATPLPSSLSPDSRLKTETTITGQQNTGRHAWISPTQSLSTVTPVRLVGTNFDGINKDTNFWTEVVANGGTVTQSGEIEIKTNTTANGGASYQTINRARFVVGSALKFQGIAKSETPTVTDNVRRFGAYDTTDGFFFQLLDGVFSIGTRNNSVDTLVSSGSFNGNYGTTLAIGAEYALVEIEWTPLNVFFYINNKLLHTVSGGHLSRFLSLPVKFENYNINGSTTDVTFDMLAVATTRYGELETTPISKYQSGTTPEVICKYGSGVIRGIILSNITLNSVIIIYDGDVATGSIIWNSGSMGNKTEPYEIDFHNLPFSVGLSFAITTQNSNMIIIYE